MYSTHVCARSLVISHVLDPHRRQHAPLYTHAVLRHIHPGVQYSTVVERVPRFKGASQWERSARSNGTLLCTELSAVAAAGPVLVQPHNLQLLEAKPRLPRWVMRTLHASERRAMLEGRCAGVHRPFPPALIHHRTQRWPPSQTHPRVRLQVNCRRRPFPCRLAVCARVYVARAGVSGSRVHDESSSPLPQI